MKTAQDFCRMAPEGYSVALCHVFDDASSISLQLDCNGYRVCGNLVAGRWSFYVPQNKRGTAFMSRLQHKAIQTFADSVHVAVGADWHQKHAALYAN